MSTSPGLLASSSAPAWSVKRSPHGSRLISTTSGPVVSRIPVGVWTALAAASRPGPGPRARTARAGVPAARPGRPRTSHVEQAGGGTASCLHLEPAGLARPQADGGDTAPGADDGADGVGAGQPQRDPTRCPGEL